MQLKVGTDEKTDRVTRLSTSLDEGRAAATRAVETVIETVQEVEIKHYVSGARELVSGAVASTTHAVEAMLPARRRTAKKAAPAKRTATTNSEPIKTPKPKVASAKKIAPVKRTAAKRAAPVKTAAPKVTSVKKAAPPKTATKVPPAKTAVARKAPVAKKAAEAKEPSAKAVAKRAPSKKTAAKRVAAND